MFCRVLILSEGDSELLANFSEPSEEPGVQPNSWQMLACDLVRRSRQFGSRASEVCLCFLGDPFPNRPASALLGDVLESAQFHSWGGTTFLVTRWDLELTALQQNRESVLEWLETARERCAADVLQVYDPSSSAIDPIKLQEAFRQTDARRIYLMERAPRGRWSCMVRMERHKLARLLEGEPWLALPQSPSDYLLVVVDRTGQDYQMPLIEEAEEKYSGRFLVVTLQVEPSDELVSFCRERGVELIAFSGVLELWYFFLRLNSKCCQEVALTAQPPIFLEPEPEPLAGTVPSILLTNAWDPNTGAPEEVLKAAADLGAILAGAPLATRSLVERAVTWGRLFQQLDWLRGPLIWAHTGPGSDQAGLIDAEGQVVPVEDWLGCFTDRGRRLPVVVFLCGGSAPVARRFAAAGAGFAIGFEGAELTAQARRLALDMLHVALQTGGSHEAILRAWDASSTTSRARGDLSRPRAYYPRR